MTAADDATPALLKDKPSWLISQVSTHAHRLLTERLATAGARGYHFRLLAALEEFGPASQASLGRRTEMDRSDVAAAVSELTGQKLAGRATDRRNIITITAKGRAHLRRLNALLAGAQDELLTPLSPGERQALAGMLTRVLDHHAGSRTPEPSQAGKSGPRSETVRLSDRPSSALSARASAVSVGTVKSQTAG
jgi:MarR family transcriptional regulator, lower aerobic nicotinate degradation pathway regulator